MGKWIILLVLLVLVGCKKEVVDSTSEVEDNNFTIADVNLAFPWTTDANLTFSWREPNLTNPMGIMIYGNTAKGCEFRVTGPNEIECSCSFEEFVKVMYSSMVNEDSNDVVLKFAD